MLVLLSLNDMTLPIPHMIYSATNTSFPYCIRKSTIPDEPSIFCFNLTKRTIKDSFRIGKKHRSPIVNFAGPIAPLVPRSFWYMGFDSTFGNDSLDYVINYGSPRKPDFYQSLQPGQMCNQNPGSVIFTRKDILASQVKRIQQNFPQLPYDIIPKTFNLPNEEKELRQAMNGETWFIWKPAMAARGETIKLLQKITDENTSVATTVQEYMTDVLLVNGHKFDMRVYFLVTSIDPFIVYMYPEGIGRVASRLYEQPTKKNAHNLHIHLTNYAVNKDEIKSSTTKVKWLMSEMLDYLAEHREFFDQGPDSIVFNKTKEQIKKQLYENIKDTQTKALLACYQGVLQTARDSTDNIFRFPRRFFGYYGSDIIFTKTGKTKIFEINASPSLGTETPEDEIKVAFLEEILNLVGMQANFDENGQLVVPRRGVPNPKIYEFGEPYVAKQSFNIHNLTKYEKRVIQQLTDEESRLKDFERIFPPAPGLYPEFSQMSYLNDLLRSYLYMRDAEKKN